MITSTYFDRLFCYQSWANQRLWGLCQECGIENVNHLFSHNLSSELIWLYRIGVVRETSPLFSYYQKATAVIAKGAFTTQECSMLLEDIPKTWMALLASISPESLDETKHYLNVKGEPCHNRLSDILIHVVNHATYHRGQISLILKNAGHTVMATDYIVFARDVYSDL